MSTAPQPVFPGDMLPMSDTRYDSTLEECRSRFAMDLAWLGLFEHDRLRIHAHAGIPPSFTGPSLPPAGHDGWHRVQEELLVAGGPDASEPGEHRLASLLPKLPFCASMPLWSNGRAVGLLIIASDTAQAFSSAQRHALRLFAGQLETSLQRTLPVPETLTPGVVLQVSGILSYPTFIQAAWEMFGRPGVHTSISLRFMPQDAGSPLLLQEDIEILQQAIRDVFVEGKAVIGRFGFRNLLLAVNDAELGGYAAAYLLRHLVQTCCDNGQFAGQRILISHVTLLQKSLANTIALSNEYNRLLTFQPDPQDPPPRIALVDISSLFLRLNKLSSFRIDLQNFMHSYERIIPVGDGPAWILKHLSPFELHFANREFDKLIAQEADKLIDFNLSTLRTLARDGIAGPASIAMDILMPALLSRAFCDEAERLVTGMGADKDRLILCIDGFCCNANVDAIAGFARRFSALGIRIGINTLSTMLRQVPVEVLQHVSCGFLYSPFCLDIARYEHDLSRLASIVDEFRAKGIEPVVMRTGSRDNLARLQRIGVVHCEAPRS